VGYKSYSHKKFPRGGVHTIITDLFITWKVNFVESFYRNVLFSKFINRFWRTFNMTERTGKGKKYDSNCM